MRMNRFIYFIAAQLYIIVIIVFAHIAASARARDIVSRPNISTCKACLAVLAVDYVLYDRRCIYHNRYNCMK